jgi:hypothetical protein
MATEYLPAAPIVQLVESRGGLPPFAVRNELAQAYYRARRSGRLTIWAADLLAVKLCHQHPALIWPEWLDCDELVASEAGSANGGM